MRVRCAIIPSDMLHISTNCRTAEKMALTLLDYLFHREVQAVSNLSGQGKHGKKQLDPLTIYGIRCKCGLPVLGSRPLACGCRKDLAGGWALPGSVSGTCQAFGWWVKEDVGVRTSHRAKRGISGSSVSFSEYCRGPCPWERHWSVWACQTLRIVLSSFLRTCMRNQLTSVPRVGLKQFPDEECQRRQQTFPRGHAIGVLGFAGIGSVL